MKISARLQNAQGKHEVFLRTGNTVQSIAISPKSSGCDSSAHGGNYYFWLWPPAIVMIFTGKPQRGGISVTVVEVMAEGDFGKEGEPAINITYSDRVIADASENEIINLMKSTDAVSEIQNTLGVGTSVILDRMETKSV